MSSPERSRTRDQSLTRSRSSTSGGRAGAARAGATGRSETAESASGGVRVGRVGEGEGSPWGPFGLGSGPGGVSRGPVRGAGSPPVRGGLGWIRRARQFKSLLRGLPDLACTWLQTVFSGTEFFRSCIAVRRSCRGGAGGAASSSPGAAGGGGGGGGASPCAAASSSSSCWEPCCDPNSARFTVTRDWIRYAGFEPREGSGNR